MPDVPDVAGLTREAAAAALTNAGLAVGTDTTASSATVAGGSVIGTTPNAGTQVSPGSTVTLQVSTGGPTQVAVPDVTGSTRATAATTLTNAGLAVGTDTTANSATVAAGSVIGTTPNAGTQVSPGSTVTLQVSTGGPTQVAVPDATGSTRATAATTLTNAGLAVGTDTTASSATVAAGSVIGTTPNAGTQVSPGSTVTLQVSTGGPAQVAVPDVTGSTRVTAATTLTNAGLAVGTDTTASSATVATGSVIGTTPNAGTQVSPGSTVTLQVSNGPAQVAVPDVTGWTQAGAEMALTNAGLAVGAVKSAESQIVPAGGVSNTNPSPGALVNQGSKINLEVSSGAGNNWYTYLSYLPTVAISLLVFGLLAAVMYGLFQKGFIDSISQERSARGLITFLIAIVTVGIALILVLANIISAGEDADKRFDRGKQVLTTMIGVLGTIVGFYFGTAVGPQTPQQGAAITANQISATNASLPDAGVGKAYRQTIQATGGTPPLKWSLAPALPTSLSLDTATGVISGTPTTTSPKTKYIVTITDSATPANSSTAEITLEIK